MCCFTGEVGAHEAAVLSLLLADPSSHHHLQHQHSALLRNNNVITKEEFYPKCESEEEFEDDFDDILLPDESEVFGSSLCKEEEGVRRSRGRSSGAEPLQQFECRHCGKRYRWKSTLRRHESVECGGKPPAHACPYCMYRAKQRGNLGVHIRKHHNAEWNAFANTKLRKTKKLTELKNVWNTSSVRPLPFYDLPKFFWTKTVQEFFFIYFQRNLFFINIFIYIMLLNRIKLYYNIPDNNDMLVIDTWCILKEWYYFWCWQNIFQIRLTFDYCNLSL